MRLRVLICAVIVIASLVLPACGHQDTPEGVVLAYAAALNSRDGAGATALIAPTFAPGGGRWLTAYARVMEKYSLEILDTTVAGNVAKVRTRERADLVMGSEEIAELEFEVTREGGAWLINAIREVTAPTVDR